MRVSLNTEDIRCNDGAPIKSKDSNGEKVINFDEEYLGEDAYTLTYLYKENNYEIRLGDHNVPAEGECTVTIPQCAPTTGKYIPTIVDEPILQD